MKTGEYLYQQMLVRLMQPHEHLLGTPKIDKSLQNSPVVAQFSMKVVVNCCGSASETGDCTWRSLSTRSCIIASALSSCMTCGTPKANRKIMPPLMMTSIESSSISGKSLGLPLKCMAFPRIIAWTEQAFAGQCWTQLCWSMSFVIDALLGGKS